MDVFISHASPDDETVTRIHNALEDAGIGTFVDHVDIIEGDNWNQRIQQALNSAQHGVFVLSPHSAENANCAAEWWSFLNQPHRRLYVVLIAPVAKEKFPWRLKVVQYADLSRDFDTGMQSLIDAMQGKRALRREDPGTDQGVRITGNVPYSHLDIPIHGRDADLQKVNDLLRGDSRLLVLKAMGGTGKTRLAVELATQGTFADGVVWQTMSEVSTVQDLTVRIRDHLGMPLESEPAAVWATLGERQVLIVLDNAESCPDAQRQRYADRLKNYALGGGSRVLMTSREQWRQTRLINRAYDLHAPDLDAAEAIVRDMAQQQGVAEQVAGHEREFAEAARSYPRLIQYALGWLHAYPLKHVLRMLRELKGADVEDALQDMLHQTLDQIAQQPRGDKALADMRKLLVCAGGFTVEAAEAIVGDVDSLGILRRWNILQLTGDRYTFDPLVEAALPIDPGTHPAHFAYYLQLAQDHKERQAYAALEPDSENLSVAFEWAIEKGDYESAFQLLDQYVYFLDNRGYFSQSMEKAEKLSDCLTDQDNRILFAQAQTLLGNRYRDHPFGNRQTNMRTAIHYYEIALQHLTVEEAVDAFTKAHNALGLAYSKLSVIDKSIENVQKAILHYDIALQHRSSELDARSYSESLNNLGAAHRKLSEHENTSKNLYQAIKYYKLCLEWRDPQVVPLSYAVTQNNLGFAYARLAKVENAEQNLNTAIGCYKNALEWRTPETAPINYAVTQTNLGYAYFQLADFQKPAENLNEAITCYQLALKYRTPKESPSGYAQTQKNLGLAYQKLGDHDAKCAAWHEAEKHYRQAGYIQDADKVLGWLRSAGCGGGDS